MLIGRTAECAQVDDLLTGARNGRGGALLIKGPAGIGKTALLDYACARSDDMRVVSASGVESEIELPFAGLTSLLRPLLKHRHELVDVQRAALDRALGRAPGGAPDRFGIGIATLSLLAAAAERRPLLVTVDDAQWVDRPSADALLFAARRLRGDRIAMLFAVRDGEEAFEAHGLPELVLGGLQPQDCERLVRRVLGGPAAPSAIERLTRETGGNPLALVELPALAATAMLPLGEGHDHPLPVGPRIRGAFSKRIAALPSHSRRALGLAAVSETGSMSEITAILTRLGMDSDALIPAELAGLVSVHAAQLHYRHPLLRSVAYHELPAPDRRLGHLALAEALSSSTGQMRRAWHLAAAVVHPDEPTACELEAAAREARRRAAPAAAAAALEAAARLTPERDTRIRRLMAAAGELQLAGRVERASALLDQALDVADDPIERADVVHLQVRVRLLDAPCVSNRLRLVAEADRIAELDPVRAAAMLIDGSLLAVMAGEPREALALAERAHPPAERHGGPIALTGAYALGVGLVLCGREHQAAPHLERARVLNTNPDLISTGNLTISFAQCQSWRGMHGRAREILSDLIERARRESVLTVLPYALAALSEAKFHLGDWHAAYADAAESVALAEEFNQRTELAHSLVRLAHIEAGMGNERPCRAHAGRALELARMLEVGSIETLAGTAVGLLELGLGRFDRAIDSLEPTGERALACGLREPGVASWAGDLAEAYARRGDRVKAEAVLTTLEEQAAAAGRDQARAAVERVRGLLATGEHCDAYFERARALLERTSLPFDVARTQLCRGERLRERGRLRSAREELLAAVAGFERLSASGWLQRAQAQMELAGDRSSHTAPDVLDELTPQELQVALAVTEGATNREVAAALFISPKTVEVHLTHIYRKLGVRSRTQLAREIRRRSGATT